MPKSLYNFNNLDEDELLPLICASAALRKEQYLKFLLARAKSISVNEKQLYESLLQNYLFTGYPSAMISLKILNEFFPDLDKSSSEGWNLDKYHERGIKNCKRIYGKKFGKLISNVKEFSPELSDWLVLEGYGKVLGRNGLSLKKRELNIVAVLSVLKFEDQLYSHINGSFKMGSSKEEIKKIINNLKLLGSEEWTHFGMKVLSRYVKEKGID